MVGGGGVTCAPSLSRRRTRVEALFIDYGLFLAKSITVVLAIAAVAVIILVAITIAARRGQSGSALTVKRLNENYESLADTLRSEAWSKQRLKEAARERKKTRKARAKAGEDAARPIVYVLDFKGDLRASAVSALREEITAIVGMAGDGDEVVLRLENPGGVVHDHGLAASQLQRIKDRGLPLTVAVDKVAASGGYMMACIGDHILAAPFAVLGSIGVLAQLPNFKRLLEDKGVDVELFKGGRFKRTVTMFGHNSDEDRAKFQQEIDEIHTLFKTYVAEHRPGLDMDRVATGEHWFGRDALELGLCDALGTSDDWLMERRERAELLGVGYKRRKRFSERVLQSVEDAPSRALDRLLQRLWEHRLDP